MNKTDIFLEKYRELEEAGRLAFKLPADVGVVTALARMPEFKHERARLKYCIDVRNLLSHSPQYEQDFLVAPSDKMITLLGSLVDRINRIPTCKDFAIPARNVYACSLEDQVLPAMNAMREHNYTHIPLLNNGTLIGVFSENTLFTYVLDNEIISVDRETRFKNLAQYLPISKHTTETFRFLSWDAQMYEAKKLFEGALERMERIGMVFLTQNGNESERILGILTPWDILGNQILI